MKTTLTTATFLGLAFALAACGDPAMRFGQGLGEERADLRDSQMDDGDLEDDEDEAPKKKRKTRAKKKSADAEVERPDALQDCPAVALHDGMDHCDHDDLAAQDEADQNAETPAPEVEPVTETPPADEPAKDPNVVEFRIKAGTGSGAWNTQDTMVVAKVGQTVRIINDDTVTHRLHTGGAPCPHGQNFAPGQSYDCVATRAFNPAGNAGPLYDHIAGRAAAFWLLVTE